MSKLVRTITGKIDGDIVFTCTAVNDYKNFEGYSFQRNYGTTIFSFFVAL